MDSLQFEIALIAEYFDECKFVVNYYHPKESADFAAAISRASSGDADPL
jgi:hypothetical protein